MKPPITRLAPSGIITTASAAEMVRMTEPSDCTCPR